MSHTNRGLVSNMCRNIRVKFLFIEPRVLFEGAQGAEEVSESDGHTMNCAIAAVCRIGKPLARS